MIIDEPEVHLHPSWEIAYANILVALAKQGVKIVISSHSPYVVEAVAKYSKEAQISEKTKFYLGEQNNGASTFRDVSNDLEPIFKKLADPMMSLTLRN